MYFGIFIFSRFSSVKSDFRRLWLGKGTRYQKNNLRFEIRAPDYAIF